MAWNSGCHNEEGVIMIERHTNGVTRASQIVLSRDGTKIGDLSVGSAGRAGTMVNQMLLQPFGHLQKYRNT